MPRSEWEYGPPRTGVGEGQEAWDRFGRRMFGRFLLILATGLVAIGAVLAIFFNSVDVGAAVGAVLVVWLVLVIAGRGIRRAFGPARDLIRAAGALADGDYTARARTPASRSMRPAVRSFNQMAIRLELADAQRRQLLADVGHELRTPLTVVRGEVEAMLDGVHQPDSEHLDLLLGEVVVMERLLDDLRTLTLAETGALALYREPTDLGALVAEVADAHRRSAAAAGVVIETQVDETVGEIDLDPVRIREVITNLVVNALSAMPGGGTLTLRIATADASGILEVRDTGVGIEPDDLPGVFDRFQKGEASAGSGLGLTISRDLVEAHGGEISVTSEPGVGTSVQVVLPKASAHS